MKPTRSQRRFIVFFAVCVAAVFLQSCATQPQPDAYNPPGFLYGLLHGFLILFSFIGSLFTEFGSMPFQTRVHRTTSATSLVLGHSWEVAARPADEDANA